MTNPFSDEQIQTLSQQIDDQLNELAKTTPRGALGRGANGAIVLPEKQVKVLVEATGEDANSFLRRFRRAARRDLCEEGGVLYAQWKKWGDLSNDKVLKSFGGILAAMGFAGGPLQMTAVALGVIVVHLGVKAICEEEAGK